MASFTGTTQYRGYTLQLDVYEASYDVSTNTSVVNWALYINNGSSYFNANFDYSATIDGSTRVSYSGNVNTVPVGYHHSFLLSSGSYTVAHDADGSKSIYCSASCSRGGPYGPGDGSCGGWLTLTTIPRAATIASFSGNDIDTDFSIGYTKYVSTWTYYLRISISGGSQLDRVVYNTSGATYRLPDSAKDIIYNTVGNNDTVNISAVIETYNGGTKIGESTALTNTCSVNRNVWIKVGGVWKKGKPYVKVNGTWKVGIPYIKISGQWRKGI